MGENIKTYKSSNVEERNSHRYHRALDASKQTARYSMLGWFSHRHYLRLNDHWEENKRLFIEKVDRNFPTKESSRC